MVTKSADEFLLLDRATLSEPFEFWRSMRDSAPIHSVSEGIGYTIVARFEDVQKALRDPATFSNQLSRKFASGMSAYQDTPAVAEVMAGACPYSDVMAFSDGEIHDQHRRMVRRGFSGKRVRELEEFIRGFVDELLAEIVTGEPVDLWHTFCERIPIRVIAKILGVVDREHDVKRWADAQVARFGEPRETEEEDLQIARDLVDFHHYLYTALADRREQRKDDFLSDLVDGSEGVSDDEMVLVCAQLVVAGAESTVSLLGSMVDQLLDNPEQMDRLRADHSLIPGAVEETLRTESPIKLVYRVTTTDTELGGVVIPANTLVLLMVASANRDELAFGEADSFDVSRADARKHFAFGMGAHLCSGAELARSEGRIALEHLLDQTSSITRAPGEPLPTHPPNMTVRSLDRLPVVLHPITT